MPKSKISSAGSKPKETKAKAAGKKEKFEFSFNNPRFSILLAFAAVVILYLLVWTEPWEQPQDPWFDAVRLVDSSKRVEDPVLKKELLDRGGSELRELAMEHPYHARVHFLLGYYYLISGNLDSAISEYKQAFSLDSGATINPVWQDAMKQMSIAYINKSRKDIETRNFEAALKGLEPARAYLDFSPELNSHFGLIFHSIRQFDSAEAYYDKALQLNPNQEATRKNLALIYSYKGTEDIKAQNDSSALEKLKRSASLNPKNADVFANIGSLYLKMNDPNTAINYFNQAIIINPRHYDAMQKLVYAYQKIGDENSARAYMNKLNSLKKK